MGTISGRVVGNIRGKVGNLVLSKWRKLYTAKGLYKKRRKKKDVVLSAQQLKVKKLTPLLRWFKEAIQIGFNKKNNKNPAWQLALAHNLKYAVIGENPDYEINFKKLKISDGNLEGAWAAKLQCEPECTTRISWKMSAMSEGTNTGKDRTYLVMYLDDTEEGQFNFEIGTRDKLSYTHKFSVARAGQVWHAWIFFISPDGKNVSNSDYCGSVVLAV